MWMSSPLAVYVLLDIDGVLLPFPREEGVEGPWDAFPQKNMAALSTIVEATEAEIVLSSTWRADPGAVNHILSEFKRFADIYGGPLGKIEEFTKTTSLSNYSVRQWEVVEWLGQEREAMLQGGKKGLQRQNGSTPKRKNQRDACRRKNAQSCAQDDNFSTMPFAWVVLDDDESMVEDRRFQDVCTDKTVLTSSRAGLTPAGAEQAIAILVRQGVVLAAGRDIGHNDSARSSSVSEEDPSVKQLSNIDEAQDSKMFYSKSEETGTRDTKRRRGGD
mmetsp:Transcript_1711/g.3404  ORF Transcript_1711/g.3404 Transcript_1711/m.3404 type:complete len:274 (-) Transcript_1711:165-986(-)